jgi:hypothetical protein
MSVTTKIVKSAITAIRDEATTTRNKWLTLEAWKTIVYHYYDFDDELGFNINLLTRALKLIGSSVDLKVCQGNTTGVHLCSQFRQVRHEWKKIWNGSSEILAAHGCKVNGTLRAN